jgi:hypothetical protein
MQLSHLPQTSLTLSFGTVDGSIAFGQYHHIMPLWASVTSQMSRERLLKLAVLVHAHESVNRES